MLSNLVANALQHTQEDAGVTVRVGTDADDAVLEVCDEGPGMGPEDAQRIFERFYRADSSTGAGQRWHRAWACRSSIHSCLPTVAKSP